MTEKQKTLLDAKLKSFCLVAEQKLNQSLNCGALSDNDKEQIGELSNMAILLAAKEFGFLSSNGHKTFKNLEKFI